MPSEWFRGQNLGDFELQFCESAAEIRANPNAIATLGMIAELRDGSNELAFNCHESPRHEPLFACAICTVILSHLLN